MQFYEHITMRNTSLWKIRTSKCNILKRYQKINGMVLVLQQFTCFTDQTKLKQRHN